MLKKQKEVEKRYIVTDKEKFLIDIRNVKGSRKTFHMMGVRWVSLFRSLVHG